MKIFLFLLILTLTSCFFFTDETEAKRDIEQFYTENNLKNGAGKTEVSAIEILSINDKHIKAFVTGYYSNSSLAIPESRAVKDTLTFEYYDETNEHKLKIVSSTN